MPAVSKIAPVRARRPVVSTDFTRGPIARTLAGFSLPILLTNLLQASMQLVNGLWVGNLLGSEAFAAVTVSTVLVMFVLAFVLGMNNATLTIFAQLKGADDKPGINAFLGGFMLLLGALSLLVAALGWLYARPLLALLGTPDVLMAEAVDYLRVIFLGTLFLIGYNFIGTMLRAFGNSRTPLYFVLLATVLAALLSPLLIAVAGFGVTGAAWAMVAAQAAAFLVSLVYLKWRADDYQLRPARPNAAQMRTILELGIPSGVQMLVISVGITVILSLVNSFGPDVIAGFGAAQRLDSLILLPALALGASVNAMAAQNIGAGYWPRVAQITQAGVVQILVVMVAMSLSLLIWAEPLVKMFIEDEGSVAFGVSYLRTLALFYPFIGLNFVFNGVVRGSGAMIQVLILNIISLWILRVPLAHGLAELYGDRGIALGIGLSFLISSVVAWGYYRWGGWRNKVLFAPADTATVEPQPPSV